MKIPAFVSLLILAGATSASAITLAGELSYTGDVTLNGGADFVTADSLSFSAINNPGAAVGDFSGVLGVNLTPFTIDINPISLDQQVLDIDLGTTTISVNLNLLTFSFVNPNSFALSGQGWLTSNNDAFESTWGQFTLSANRGGSFSAGVVVPVPEVSTIASLMLGTLAVGLLMIRSRSR